MVPTVVVSRGDGPVLDLPERPRELDVGDFLDTQYVDGLAVLHEGALVLEAYRNEMRPETLHLSQSVGKSVLGLLVGVLHGRGALDPATPVVEHVPEVAGSGYEGATVQHLLDMTAAIDFVEDYATFWRYDVACAWHPPHPRRDRATRSSSTSRRSGPPPTGRTASACTTRRRTRTCWGSSPSARAARRWRS